MVKGSEFVKGCSCLQLASSSGLFLKWVGRRGESPEKMARVSVRTEEQDFLKTFLLDLPKVPSHYCRSSSSKMYLEPFFKSISHLHTQYKQSCADHSIQPLSRQVLTNTFNDLNLSLFHPKKDQCDTCCAFKAGNIEAAVWEEQKGRCTSRKGKGQTTCKQHHLGCMHGPSPVPKASSVCPVLQNEAWCP